MKQYSCKRTDLRGRVTRQNMQDGYKPGTREPHMVEVVTKWIPTVACGYLARATDPLCADCMGQPLDALAWLADHLASIGRGLLRGDVVITGSIITSKFVKAGDRVR